MQYLCIILNEMYIIKINRIISCIKTCSRYIVHRFYKDTSKVRKGNDLLFLENVLPPHNIWISEENLDMF